MSLPSVSSQKFFVDFGPLTPEAIRAEKEKLTLVLPVSSHAKTVFDLSREERLEIEERMQPGEYSEVGFLKIGDRLLSVCIQDGYTLLGNPALLESPIPCHLIADVVSSIIEAAQRSDDPAPIVFGRFKVTKANLCSNGYQECPYGFEETMCHVGNNDPVITNIFNGVSVLVNSLTIDMIRDHFFFQTGPYRIDPKEIIECIELRTIQYEMVTETTAKYRDSELLDDDIDEEKYGQEKIEAKKYAPSFKIADGVAGYILPYRNREAYEDGGKTIEQKIRGEGYSKGLTEEEIESELDAFENGFAKYCIPRQIRSTVIEREEKEGDRYLHVFCDVEPEEGEVFFLVIDSSEISLPCIQEPGIYVFKLKTRKRANIALDSTVSESVTHVSKKRRLE